MLAIAALLALVWWATKLEIDADRARTEKDAFRDTANLARAFAVHCDRTLNGIDQITSLIKFEYERANGAIDLVRLAQDRNIDVSIFNQIGVIDAQGIYQMSNLADFKKVDLSDREHFKVHREGDSGKPFISKPVVGRASGKESVQVTRRLNKPDGSFAGVVVISVDPLYFSGIYKELDLGARGVVALVGMDGVVRVRQTGSNGKAGQDVSATRIAALVRSSPAGSAYSTAVPTDGTARIASFRRLEAYSMWVLVGLAEDDVFAPFSQRRQELISFAGMATAAILFFAFCLLLLTRLLGQSRNEAEKGARASSRFLRTMARDLQTPLHQMERQAQEIAAYGEPLQAREAAERIANTARRMLKLVGDVHEVAELDAGAAQVTLRREPLGIIVSRVMASHSTSARAKGLMMGIEMSPDAPETILCDRRLLTRILGRFVQNAIRFTARGAVRIVITASEGGVRISVIDTGPGIDPDVGRHLFDVDAAGGDQGASRDHGGLAVSKGLAVAMKMEIGCISAPGQGAEFWICAPVRPAA